MEIIEPEEVLTGRRIPSIAEDRQIYGAQIKLRVSREAAFLRNFQLDFYQTFFYPMFADAVGGCMIIIEQLSNR